ncbi:hypothetical protein [uncultured Maribacter sp.]|uniref:hypothetical protein n=1 Tax=uncultured Maribacter sp. TaxID=431308 RepID=UPI0026221457|nr:hypothetical protein [uncultured Maribacter sp.]
MKFIVILSVFIFVSSCRGQQKIIDLSDSQNLSYYIANIKKCNFLKKNMFDDSFFISIFEILETRTDINNFSEGKELSSSYLISILPDGDYYSSSKLFKIEGLINPKIVEILEKEYPKFNLMVETGNYNERIIEIYNLDGIIE